MADTKLQALDYTYLSFLYISLSVTACLFAAGIGLQAQYSPAKVCLFFINSMQPAANGGFTFSATSQSCEASIIIGGVSLVALLIVAVPRLWLVPYRNVTATGLLATFATLWFIVFLSIASVATAGLESTCQQFSNLGRNCQVQLTALNFGSDPTIYSQDYNLIKTAINAGWVHCTAWLLVSIYEWRTFVLARQSQSSSNVAMGRVSASR